jgi:feruloyl-CoA synthase
MPHGAADPAQFLACEGVRGRFASLLTTFNAEAGGSSRRLARLILMDHPPSLDTGELTDKGSVNQRTVLNRRAAMVEELYADRPSRRVIM